MPSSASQPPTPPAQPADQPANLSAGTTYTITELAREFDITPRAIRFYEEAGLLEPGRKGRNRVYTDRKSTRLNSSHT